MSYPTIFGFAVAHNVIFDGAVEVVSGPSTMPITPELGMWAFYNIAI